MRGVESAHGRPFRSHTTPVKLLLHTCCGPCLIEPLDELRSVHDVTVYFANPNIQPLDEFERRRETLRGYAAVADAALVEAPHEPERWLAATGAELAKPGRCRACYRLRLDMTARAAAELGFEAVATTLTVSPYQDGDAIRAAGESAAAGAGLHYVHRDFRERYPYAAHRARELGLYRQNYCGCLLSRAEADAERAARRSERHAAREARERGKATS